MGAVGLIRLEPRSEHNPAERRYSLSEMYGAVTANPQARLFFIYLIMLLAAILGQDVLLEPFGAQALGMSPGMTSRLTSYWGTATLLTLIIAGWLQTKLGKKGVARIGAWGALIGFVLIAISGFAVSTPLFLTGIVLHGLGTGLATVSNLSLMLDMTTPQNVGLFIGAWGMANAFSRLTGQLMSGILRDVFAAATGNSVLGYVVVFSIEAVFLFISLMILRRIDVDAFQKGSASAPTTLVERAALMGEAGGD
jgi:BCD family chlorophyll transporter-like MFS transporter